MKTHEQTEKLLLDHVLGELSEHESEEVKAHLAECQECSSQVQQFEALNECTAYMRTLSADEQTCESATRSLWAAVESEQMQKPASGPRFGPVWRTVMRSRITKFATAAAVLIVVGLGVVAILQNGGQTAYALEQTIEALQGKRSIHVRVFAPSPTTLHDEMWAEFDENGKVVRYRQEEGSERDERRISIWKDNVRTRYKPGRGAWITKTKFTEDLLESVEPELVVQTLQKLQAVGLATIEIQEPSAEQPHITLSATYDLFAIHDLSTYGPRLILDVLLVDPDTKFVNQFDRYERVDDDWKFFCHVEVVEYNQPIDPNMYTLDLPEDVVVFDQVSQKVGMVQGDLSLEELAAELVRQALEAWKAEDYAEAGRLLGGAPADFVAERLQPFKPVGTISIGQAVVIEHWRSGLDVPCEYEVERDGQVQMVKRTWRVLGEPGWQKVDDQPDRWWVDVRWLGK